MMKNNNDFEFKYSAPTAEERREIESIRNSYKKPEKSATKLERLRALDNKVKNVPIIISLILGIVGVLIFGLGLTMVLYWYITVWGIIVGAVGIVPMCLAYPVHVKVSKKMKEKYSGEILKLSDELLNEDLNKRVD